MHATTVNRTGCHRRAAGPFAWIGHEKVVFPVPPRYVETKQNTGNVVLTVIGPVTSAN